MNNTTRDLIYLDVAVNQDEIDRIIIEPCNSTSSYYRPCDFEKFFYSRHTDDVLPLLLTEVRFKSYVKFAFRPSGSNNDNDNSNNNSSNSDNNLPSPSRISKQKHENSTSSTNGNVLPEDSTTTVAKHPAEERSYYEELPMGLMLMNETRNDFYMLTCPWRDCTKHFTDFNVFGRVFKGMSSLIYISSLDVSAKLPPKKTNSIYIKDFGVIPPGVSLLGLKRRELMLDQYPFLPQDALSVNFYDTDRVLNVAYSIKSSGNILFRQGKHDIACFRFDKAVRYLSYAIELRKTPAEQEDRLISLAVACMLDSATCKIKKKDFDGALHLCNEALEHSANNFKAYFRRGQAHHGLLNYEQSLLDLHMAKRLKPNDKAIKNEIAAVQGEMQVYCKKANQTTN